MTQTSSLRAGLARARSRGVSLITAVFLVVVLAGLVAAVVRLTVVQQSTASMDMLGVQAYQAARAGLEWGLYQQLRVQPASGVGCFASPKTFALPPDGALRNFTVTVTCSTKAPNNTVGDTTNRWTIVAVACNQPNGAAGCPNPSNNVEYVQRRVQAEL
jgi:MSHA biogenesis protein MshP